MYSQRVMAFVVVGIGLIFFLSGCVSGGPGGWAKVVAQPRKTEEKLTIQELQGNWQKYNIYYSGVKVTNPKGILFDPKNGDRTVKPDKWWGEVGDEKTLTEAVEWMNAGRAGDSFPQVNLILGPDDQVFGYVYTYNDVSVRTRLISEKEIRVYDLTKR